jgi:hypothetical protein
MVYLLLMLVLMAIPTTALAAGVDMKFAPFCSQSFDRNWSVDRANAINATLGRMGTGPLVYPRLGEAKELIRQAGNHLEQVMNYYLFYPSFPHGAGPKCMSCIPLSIRRPAERLAALEKVLTGSPLRGSGDSIVSTITTNEQIDDYCGYYAKHVDISDVAGNWEFGRVGGPVLCPATYFRLNASSGGHPHGLEIRSCHPNESFYWLFGGVLAFVDRNGNMTSVLHRKSSTYWEGPFRPLVTGGPQNVRHYIKRVKTTPTTVPTTVPPPPPPPPAGAMEQGMNRRGRDYRGFELPQPWPENCRTACANESQCKAWTYVKPGIQAQKAKCWLKSSVPPPTADPNCVSGVKGAAAAGPLPRPPVVTPPSAAQYFVYYRTGEFSCCKNTRTGWVPHPIHVEEVRQWKPDYVKLGGPFPSAQVATQWACDRPVRSHDYHRNWADFGGRQFTGLPCPINAR